MTFGLHMNGKGDGSIFTDPFLIGFRLKKRTVPPSLLIFELNYSGLHFRSHRPLNPEEHWPDPVTAAGDDHPFFLHPGKLPPERRLVTAG